MVPSASLAAAVIPTAVPATEFSSTASAVASLSLIGLTSNSSTSATVTEMAWKSVPPAPSLTRTVTS